MSIEKINETIWRIAGDKTLEDLYKATDDKLELFVEPLGKSVPLGRFIKESGLGYGSLTWGGFGRFVNVMAAGIKTQKEHPFRFGYEMMGHTNTAYPMHRIVEGSETMLRQGLEALYDKAEHPLSTGDIQELVVQLRPKKDVKAYYQAKPLDDMLYVPDVKDIFFVNDTVAKWFELEKEGWVVATRDDLEGIEGTACDKAWSKRFIEERFDAAQYDVMKLLTTSTGVKAIYAKVKENSANPFFALRTQKGILVLLGIAKDQKSALEETLKELKLTYRIRG